MTTERYNELMNGGEDAKLTNEEMAQGWHWCWEFDGLLRNNNEDKGEYQCDCLEE